MYLTTLIFNDLPERSAWVARTEPKSVNKDISAAFVPPIIYANLALACDGRKMDHFKKKEKGGGISPVIMLSVAFSPCWSLPYK